MHGEGMACDHAGVSKTMRRLIDIRVMLALCVVAMIVAVVFAVLNDNPGNYAEATVATIVIEDENWQTVIVDFVTAEGVACHTNVDAGAFGYSPPPVVHGRFWIEYDGGGDPCSYVQRIGWLEGNYWFLLYAALVAAAVGLIYWRRPELFVFGGKISHAGQRKSRR